MTRYVNTASTAGGDGTTNATTGANRAYASIVAAEAAEQASLSEPLTIECCGATADPGTGGGTTIDGWTLTAANYLLIRGNPSDAAGKHAGVFSTSHYHISDLHGLFVRENFAHIADLQIVLSGGGGFPSGKAVDYGVGAVSANSCRLERCILKGVAAGGRGVIFNAANAAGASNAILVANNIIFDFPGHGIDYVELVSGIAYAYNNTVHNCGVGIDAGSTKVLARNNVVQDCTTCYTGTFITGTEYNCSDDNTQPGTNGQNGEVAFLNEAGDDFHLDAADTVAKGNGLDLSGDADFPLTDDIDGDTRAAWDMGADETAAAGGSAAGDLHVPSAALAAAASIARELAGVLAAPAAVMGASIVVTRSVSAAMAAPASTLAGAATIPRTAAGAFAVPSAALAASVAIARTASGVLGAPAPALTAAADVARHAAGALVTPVPLASAAVSVARSVAGTLSVAPLGLVASADAGRTASGALTLPAPSLSAAAARVVESAGDLTVPAPALAAAVAVAHFASGELVLVVPVLSASVAGEQLTASGVLVVPMPVIDGDALVARHAAGALVLTGPVLDGNAVRLVEVDSVLLLRAPTLEAQAAIARTVSGDLDASALVLQAAAFVGVLQPLMLTRATVQNLTTEKTAVSLTTIASADSLTTPTTAEPL